MEIRIILFFTFHFTHEPVHIYINLHAPVFLLTSTVWMQASFPGKSLFISFQYSSDTELHLSFLPFSLILLPSSLTRKGFLSSLLLSFLCIPLTIWHFFMSVLILCS